MVTLSEARHHLAEVGLVEGLPYATIDEEIGLSLRLGECMQRRLAFFLCEMAERGLHVDEGHSSIEVYAYRRHGLSERRVREILFLGRRLRELPEIDRAFCAQEISWGKTKQLLRVAVPDNQQAWIERARKRTLKELTTYVRLHKRGESPRDLGDMKGLAEPRWTLRLSLGPDAHKKESLARQKLAAELGRSPTPQDVFEHMLDLYLQFQSTGEVEGYRYVPSSLYRVHLYPLVAGEGDGAPLFVETDGGLVPLDGIDADGYEAKHRAACARCDGECVGEGEPVKDEPTPARMRRRVLDRDGGKCRCCGSRVRVHVHHIVWRSHGGPTKIWNLIATCSRCHALVHEGLIGIRGKTQKKARFVDRQGRPLHGPGEYVDPKHLVRMEAPPRRPLAARLRASSPDAGAEAPAAVPESVDASWWRAHADRIVCRSDRTFAYRANAPLREEPEAPEAPEETPGDTADAGPEAFGGLVGQAELVDRLEGEAKGAEVLGRAFPNTLLSGPAGTGKTTIARAIAGRLGARLVRKNGPLLGGVSTLLRLLATLRDGDVLFLDEIHAVPHPVLEVLYEAMDDGRLSLTFRQGATEQPVVLTLARFTLIGATTHPADLPQPLRARMELPIPLMAYSAEALAAAARARADQHGFAIEDDAALRLASRARGIPREVLRLVERAVALAAGRGAATTTLDLGLVDTMLRQEGFDEEGLRAPERRYLETLRAQGRATSAARLADLLRLEVRTVLREVEPELLRRGLVRITERGRVAAAPLRGGPGRRPPEKQGSPPWRPCAGSARGPSRRGVVPGSDA